MLRYQVKTLNKIEYIKSRDGDTKIQQDMLIVSIPLVELHDDSRLTENTLIQAGKGVEHLR